MKVQYIVKNPYGITVRVFNKYEQANTYVLAFGNKNYSIQRRTYDCKKPSTTKQKAAVDFIEQCLQIEFTGDIENFYEVSEFIGEYLEDAKIVFEDAKESYYSNFDY